MRLAIPNKAWVAWSRAQRTSGRTEAGCIALLCRRWRRTGSRRVRRAALIGTMPRSTQEHPGAPRSKDKEDRAANPGTAGRSDPSGGYALRIDGQFTVTTRVPFKVRHPKFKGLVRLVQCSRPAPTPASNGKKHGTSQCKRGTQRDRERSCPVPQIPHPPYRCARA